jgi:hypothetical protein
MIQEFVRRSKNLPPNQFDLPWENFREISIGLPPVEEQRRIAEYLDLQCGVLEKMENDHEKVGLNIKELTKQ